MCHIEKPAAGAQQVAGVKEGAAGEASSDGATEHAERLPRVEGISDEDDEVACKLAPIAYAKLLCEQAGLTREQHGPVALIAHDMDKKYQEEMSRREKLTEAQRESLGCTRPGTSLMPLSGRVARILIFGGGGCGKTKIINDVLTPLFRRFYGLRGCVLTAFSNKAARLINGKTSHALTKLYGGMSLTMASLRIKTETERRALAAAWAPCGALVKDEFSQQAASLEHALVVRAMYGRERCHDLCCEDYAQPETNYAAIPFVATFGDPLQFPPVPASTSLLSEETNLTKEHRCAELMFQSQDYVCELKTTMRYQGDPILSRILLKMRTVAEDRSHLQLTEEEWKVLQSTDVNHGASLDGTELWYHAAFAWSYVAMAQYLRSVYSASHHKETLFMVAAQDYISNVDNKDLRAARDALLKIPNMNTTGRLPAVAMFHVGMKVRLTLSICPLEAPVDSIGW